MKSYTCLRIPSIAVIGIFTMVGEYLFKSLSKCFPAVLKNNSIPSC